MYSPTNNIHLKNSQKSKMPLDRLVQAQNEQIIVFIEAHIPMEFLQGAALCETGSAMNIESLTLNRNPEVHAIINLKRLNDMRYINKCLEAMNRSLPLEGFVVGCFETKDDRRRRIMAKYVFPINTIFYFFDFVLKRIIPKLYGLKKIYFALTRGQNRIVSTMEGYGRLYSCGFELLQTQKIGSLHYFIVKKTGEPAYNKHATYGPIVRLKRVGKGGKLFNVYKLRTMFPFSEYLQPYINEKYGLQEGGKFANDPRIPIWGKFFRKFWIDELPMLFNLLKGDMKLVGVRPLSAHYLSLYPADAAERRKKYKPGLLPPFYADMPKTIEEIVASELKYFDLYDKKGILADISYFFKIWYNILIKKARSK
jgi:lipopolysaccharide/colanic/teichoic acid biosynthesis glycosyltransferase